MKFTITNFAGFIIALIVSTISFSENAIAQKQISFKHLTINNGLSQNSVFSIFQDKDDYIWIGTEDGLNRFDGYEFTIYKHENNNPKSISNSRINAIYEDPRGNLWIGTADGLNLFDKNSGSFTRIRTGTARPGGTNDPITSIVCDSYGNLWIGTFDGLKLYDSKTNKVRHFKTNNKQSLVGSNKVQTIFEDRGRLLWISIGKDLKRFDPVHKKFQPLPASLEKNPTLRKSKVRIIRQDKNGHYWFGTETEGLFRFDPKTAASVNYKHDPVSANSLPISIIRDLSIVSEQEIWIGTREGLSILNPITNQFQNYTYNRYDPKALSHNSIRSIMRDKSGNMWLGTFAGGLNIYQSSNSNFSYIGEQLADRPGLNHPVVSSILKADNGALWVGTEGGGLNYIDRRAAVYKTYVINSKQQNIVKSLAKDKTGHLWIGTYDGLVNLDTRSGKFKNYKIGGNGDKPGNNQIYALAVADSGVWIGTDGQGLVFRSKEGTETAFLHNSRNKNSISGNNIIALLTDDGSQNLWIGTETGLNYYDKKKGFTPFLHNDAKPYSISHNSVSSLFIDSRKRVWIGTKGGGLNIYDRNSGRFYALTQADGLANNVIHSIREDNTGRLWVSTNNGLSVITFKSLSLPLSKKNLDIINYSVADGLQSNQFSSGASETGEDGELFFGGINGITSFHPQKISKNRLKPNVVLTDFFIKNNPVKIHSENSPLKKTIGETASITLPYDQAFITFKFAALNYINPEKNQYAYKLDGFADDEWHYVGNQRTATYTNLDAGKYTFRVKAANNDGVWNDKIREITITVLPPWWETWWAYTLYILLIGSLLYLFYYYSYKTANLKSELVFEHMSREKDQELAQRKLSFFTHISHEIKTPLTLILAPIDKLVGMNEGNNKIQNQLMLMQRNGERLVRLINQLLDFRKFETGSMKIEAAEGDIVRFIKEVVMAFDSYARHKNIKLKVISEKDSVRTWFDRDKFEKIMYNLLSNALKFTPEEGKVVIRISTEHVGEKEFVRIEIEDNGIGIPPENIDKIFEQFNHYDEQGINNDGTGIGLSFSKGLIEMHHGEIHVKSTPSTHGVRGSTCFMIKVPLGKQHFSEAEIISDFKDSENISTYYETDIPVAVRVKSDKRKCKVLQSMDKEKPIMLIVEDNSDVLHFIESHFEELFEVHTATQGAEGWEKALSVIPDIIISDVMMPELSGTALCSKLKSDSRTSHIPVILLTARTPLIFKVEGYETGADDYITKPFNLNILESRIWNLLESRQVLRERYRKDITLQPRNVAITSPDEKFLDKVMNYIEENISESTLSVEELGKEVGMSRVTLYRKIKALTNQSAVEFIRTIRLKRAGQLLQQNKLNVSEVAYMVGFLDIDYFRKCFKDQFGSTPKEYASLQQKNDMFLSDNGL
ncbi:MAG TPA: two-component regulator propeller domain-containing protein [Sphingobacteriaceae bacterium]|nr:two-component regulator propeller domain-containing protein [Sphingobacteriaceae bacterium]